MADRIESKTSILVVDDDPDILFATSRILKKKGYKVFESSSGKDCIEKAKDLSPDLILLDVVLPDISGKDVCRQLKKEKDTAPISVILLSSLKTQSLDQSRGLELGADDYITRPIENRELAARIEAHLRLKAARNELAEKERLLSAVVNGIPSQLYLIDPDFRITWTNATTQHELDRPEHELIGRKCHDLLMGNTDTCTDCPAVTSFQTATSAQDIVTFPDGTIKQCKSIPMINDEGRVERVLKIDTDISARQKAEDALIKQQTQLEDLVGRRTSELEKEILQKKETEEALRRQQKVISANNRIARVFLTSRGNLLWDNVLKAVLDVFKCRSGLLGYTDNEGRFIFPTLNPHTWPNFKSIDERHSVSIEDLNGPVKKNFDDKKIYVENGPVELFIFDASLENAAMAPLLVDNRLSGLLCLANKEGSFVKDDIALIKQVAEFIAPIMNIFIEREEFSRQLQFHAKKLEEKNIALNVLLENRDENNKRISETIISSFERLVFPYHDKIKQSENSDDILTLLKIIERNTMESLSPLIKAAPNRYSGFTPMEIQVADLIKSGKSSKEIASVMNISERSVYFHRNNIRKKLKIDNKKENLRAHLLSD